MACREQPLDINFMRSGHARMSMQKFVRRGAEMRASVALGRPPGIHGDLISARTVFTRYRALAALERERERSRRGLGGAPRRPRRGPAGEVQQERSSRRGPAGEAWESFAEATERPRRGPGEAQQERLGRCFAEAKERPRRGREEARRGLGEVRSPSDVKEGLGDALRRPERGPEAQGKPRKRPKEAREKLGRGPGQAPKRTQRLCGRIQARPMRASGEAREAQGLIFA